MYRRSRVRPGISAVIRRKWMSAPAIIKGRVVVKNPKGKGALEQEQDRRAAKPRRGGGADTEGQSGELTEP